MVDRGTSGQELPRRSRLAWTVGLIGAALFSALALVLVWWDGENEQRLLDEQTAQAGVVLTVSINEFLEPLTSIARTADATDGDTDVFSELADQMMSGDDALPYSSIALVDGPADTLLSTRGAPLTLASADAAAISAPSDGTVGIRDLLDERALGFATSSPSGRFVVYAERQLSSDPNVRQRSDGPFGSLDYAIYLGDASTDALLGASTRDLPLTAPSSSATVPYGDSDIVLVTTPTRRLGDSLLAHLWWIVWLVGLVVTGVIAFLLGHLQASRQRALELARLNEAQHREQRDIAETLQLELLPQDIAPPPGLRMATRYWVADTASLIGGDTYDVFQIDERRWAVLVGDVCGKGTEAAALTGLVRHTARTAARYRSSPASVLEAVHAAMAEHRPRTFCTAALMFYEPDTVGDGNDGSLGGRLTVALGGHPPPLLRSPDGTVRPVGRTGTILGLIDPVVHDETVRLEPGSTLLAYTDGLTDAAGGRALTVDDLRVSLAASHDVDEIVEDVHQLRASRQAGGSDDTVILVLSVDDAHTPTASTAALVAVGDGADGAPSHGRGDDGDTLTKEG